MTASSYRRPGPDLSRVDKDATAKGTCLDCDKALRSFEDCTRHAAAAQHAVSVTEERTYLVVPRGRRGDLA